MARVLVTGASGQVGSYLCEQLLAAGHRVHGTTGSLAEPLPEGVTACHTPLQAPNALRLLEEAGSLDAVVHLAGRARVATSWAEPEETFALNAGFTAALVAALRAPGSPALVHASSAELFGPRCPPVQDESTPVEPGSPYGVSKAAAHWMVRVGREGYKARMSNAIFYMGESERRPPSYVFRKITRGLAAVSLGKEPFLSLGDTSVRRDFLHARDLASAAALLALSAPAGDYVVASGEGHTVREVALLACELLGLDPARVLREDPSLRRPTDLPCLVGNSAKLRALGWAPTLDFRGLVEHLVRHDLAQLRGEAASTTNG